jgi:hypothetical protein
MKVIHLFDQYRPRPNDDPTTAIRRLLLRRPFKVGERVVYCGDQGTVLEVDTGYVRVLWDRRTSRSQWHDALDVHRIG